MSEFAALITGAIAGALVKESAPHGPFLIDVNVPTDSDGNYLYVVEVTGKESGEVLRIEVKTVEMA